MEPSLRSLIVVSGAPGSGKTTVARELGRRLGFPLISKDTIKEALYDALPGRHTSTELSDAAMEVLWAIAHECRQAILEANFEPSRWFQRLSEIAGRKIEVHCVCPLSVCAERYNQRASSQEHHPVHPKSISMESLAKYAGPIAACPVIEVNTEAPMDAGEVVARVREQWPDV